AARMPSAKRGPKPSCPSEGWDGETAVERRAAARPSPGRDASQDAEQKAGAPPGAPPPLASRMPGLPDNAKRERGHRANLGRIRAASTMEIASMENSTVRKKINETAVLRGLSDMLHIHGLCGRSACRRARSCRGEPRAC